MLYRLICMECGREGPGVEFKVRLVKAHGLYSSPVRLLKFAKSFFSFLPLSKKSKKVDFFPAPFFFLVFLAEGTRLTTVKKWR